MNPRTATTPVPVLVRGPSPPEMDLEVPADRLLRVRPEVYRGMIEHGLIADAEVALVDGLLRRGEGLYRMPLEVYERVAELGLIGPGDRAELRDGLLVKKMTKGNPRIVATMKTMKALERVVPDGWIVLKEDPVVLPSGPFGLASEPEPDVAVVRGELDDILIRKPGPAETALIVEVAESSLRADRDKLARYAWENVPVVWVVDLNARAVEVHASPSGPVSPTGYRAVEVFGPADRVPVVVVGVEVGRIAVSDLLPRPFASGRREEGPAR